MNLEYFGSEALSIASGNDARAWADKSSLSAKSRFAKQEFFTVHHRPKFLLSKDWSVFTIGSCFARNVENELQRLGVPLAIAGHGNPPEAFADWNEETQTGGDTSKGRLSRRAFNKYDVHALTHELRRTILDVSYPNEGLIELDTDRWFDPHGSALRPCTFESAVTNRRTIAAAMMQIRMSKVVILTFGLTESWIDTETGLAMNEHPGPMALKRFGTRFKFIDYGYQEIAWEVGNLIELIRDQVDPDMKIIISVSPVPLWATFRGTDVVVANTGSKAVLRAVADEMYRTYDFVDYFPSYEMVQNSPRSLAWRSDQHHVTDEMVAHIMNVFSNSYYPSTANEHS
jgi:hypothetical protein